MLKPLICIIAVILAGPAMAEEYWVQYDYSTHECSIVESATHQTETHFPWSPPNDGSKPTEPLNGGTAGRTSSSAAKESGSPNGSDSTARGTNGNAAPTDSNTSSGAGNESAGAASPNSTNNESAAANSTNNRGASGNTNNEEQEDNPLAAAWKRKAELAQKEKVDVSKALIGSAMQSREEAEEEMHIMRKCGLKN